MAIERIYNVPLRKGWLKVPKYKRAKKAVTTVREFLVKNMKTEDVKIGKYLNLTIWEHGMKNPPHHVKVKVTKDDSGKVYAEIIDAPVAKATVEDKVKKAEAKTEVKSEEKKEAAPKTEAPKAEKKKAPSKDKKE